MRSTGMKGKVLKAERQLRVGQLILSTTALPGLDEQARSVALVNLVRRKGIELLPWNPELRQWQARVDLLRQLDIRNDPYESKWHDLSDTNLLETLEEWLAPYLGKVTRLSHFSHLDLSSIVEVFCLGRFHRSWRLRHLRQSGYRPARTSVSTIHSIHPFSRSAVQELFILAKPHTSPLVSNRWFCISCRRPVGLLPFPRIWQFLA